MKKRALYPGTFDPFTNGHLHMAQRAAAMYPEVIIAVSGHDKKRTLFDVDTRVSLIEKSIHHLPNVRVMAFDNLLAEFAKQVGAEVVIRGLRVNADFEYEFKMAQFNYEMNPVLEVVYLMATASTLHIASSSIKEIAGLGGDVSAYVPAHVNIELQKEYA